MMLRNFPGFSTQLVCKNYCIPRKNVNVSQTLLYTKETSTYNFMHKVSKNLTPIVHIKAKLSVYSKKLSFLKYFIRKQCYSQLSYTQEIFP